ncbi:MAG: MarR family transcriptional regulator, partial [Acidimicrobiia bacterium]|nr:MarR family transcriptional regulator [Acidimicrobiia bacterium]
MGSPDRGATFVPPDDRDTRLMAAASMYYVQHEKMDTIARRLHTSRSTVSRMLKEARERGLVEITLRERPTRPTGSALAIRQHYDV